MENGVNRGARSAETHPRALAHDARGAIVLAEGAMVRSLDAGAAGAAPEAASGHNAFGDRVTLETAVDPVTRVRRAATHIAKGERVGLIASVRELVLAREVMAEMASQRLAAVFHAVEADGAEAAYALADLGWAVLFASGVEESLDLTVVARRAAEDSGTPFLVVHDLPRVRPVEPLVALDDAFVSAFVGSPETRLHRVTDPGHPSHAQIDARGFAERVPFALASAMRELESLTGRKRDLITRSATAQGADAALMLVAAGALGDILLGEIPRLRAMGHDVAALKITAFRPFPGPRIVRLLARALAVTVLEQTDAPLAQSNPLTREVKSAFSDALTWAPEYPGIGRVPRVHSGVMGAASNDLEARDLDAIVRNMVAGDQGKRFFILGGAASLDLERSARAPVSLSTDGSAEGGLFHMRGLLRDGAFAATAAELTAVVIARVLGLKVRASIRPLVTADGGGFAFDLVAGAERPLGVHVASSLSLVVLEDATALIHGNPLARLAHGATLAVPTRKPSAEAVWGDMPPYAKAIVFDRDVRVVGWESAVDTDGEEATRWLSAAAFVGVTLAALVPAADGEHGVDPSLVLREVGEVVERLSVGGAAIAARAGEVARRAFQAGVSVPRGLVERDEDAIRLGRKDARSALA